MKKRKPASQEATQLATLISSELFGRHHIQRVEEIAAVIDAWLAEYLVRKGSAT